MILQGRIHEAHQIAAESFSIIQELGLRDYKITAYLMLSGVQIYNGQYELACQNLSAPMSYLEQKGDNALNSWLFHIQGLLALAKSSYSEAQSAITRSIEICVALLKSPDAID